jgi:hypothetical protein
MSLTKNCIVCDKEFIAKNDKGIYCSNSCRVKAYRIRTKEEKQVLEKNISEEYAEELSFFRTKLNHLFEQVDNIKSEMASVTKYMIVFAEKIVDIPRINNTNSLESRIDELTSKLENELIKLNDSVEKKLERHEQKIEKNDDNIKTIGLKINEIVHILNNVPEGNSMGSAVDKILENKKFNSVVDVLINKVSGKKDKVNEAS